MIYRMALRLLCTAILLLTSLSAVQAAGWDNRFGPPGVDGGGWYPTVLISPPQPQ